MIYLLPSFPSEQQQNVHSIELAIESSEDCIARASENGIEYDFGNQECLESVQISMETSKIFEFPNLQINTINETAESSAEYVLLKNDDLFHKVNDQKDEKSTENQKAADLRDFQIESKIESIESAQNCVSMEKSEDNESYAQISTNVVSKNIIETEIIVANTEKAWEKVIDEVKNVIGPSEQIALPQNEMIPNLDITEEEHTNDTCDLACDSSKQLNFEPADPIIQSLSDQLNMSAVTLSTPNSMTEMEPRIVVATNDIPNVASIEPTKSGDDIRVQQGSQDPTEATSENQCKGTDK